VRKPICTIMPMPKVAVTLRRAGVLKAVGGLVRSTNGPGKTRRFARRGFFR
jgi:hypothetical protein